MPGGQLFSYKNQDENIEEISAYIMFDTNILQLIEITLSIKLLLPCN